jgi:hypothetical protein
MPTLVLRRYIESSMGRLSRLDSRLRTKCVSTCRLKWSHYIEIRMTRKTPLCRNCGMPMKGHARSGCRMPNSPEQKYDGASMTPSFVIPETGPFRRQNPNYIPPPPPQMEPLILSSAFLAPTEPVYSVNTMQRSFRPIQQFTPNWSTRPSSPQPHPSCRIPKQQYPSFVLESASPVDALYPASVFGVQPGDDDSVNLVAGIYQVPSTTVESLRTRALSNGIYCVPLKEKLLLKEEEEVEERSMQNDDSDLTWIITGPDPSDVDALVAILQPPPRGIMQMFRDMVLYYGALALLLLLCVF